MYKVSWIEFESLAIDLTKKIKASNKNFTFIVGVSRGGLLLARLLSSTLGLPLGIITAKHVDGAYHVDNYISSIFDVDGEVLLVDDVMDDASKEVILKIKTNYKDVTSITSACIFYKGNKTNFKPNFFISKVEDFITILFPYQEKSILKNLENSGD
jgi:hypoxanthine phosphoribosyltransferase